MHSCSVLKLESKQIGLALLVTNLQIVTILVYRKFRGGGSESSSQTPIERPFDSDAGTATRERIRTGIDNSEMGYYATTVPSYTIASIAPTSIPSSTSTSEPNSTSIFISNGSLSSSN